MAGIALSSDEIKAAPPEVRRWLKEHMARLADSSITPQHAAQNLPPSIMIGQAEKPHPTAVPTTTQAEAEAEKQCNTPLPKADSAITKAALRKLIAERAYALWENQGKPYGCDMIHWREAEQEIMRSLQENEAPPAASRPGPLWPPDIMRHVILPARQDARQTDH